MTHAQSNSAAPPILAAAGDLLQRYDLIFCDVWGVVHNGVKIHDKVKITSDNTTSGLGGDPAQPGPILLQDHGNPVQYRNIWLVRE